MKFHQGGDLSKLEPVNVKDFEHIKNSIDTTYLKLIMDLKPFKKMCIGEREEFLCIKKLKGG